ncbi:MAG TPA: bifunctional demethylmenaquinone methyltransferase/2-methoxy-6-polyprenyl-1,4-benzoquinol methylase UbiE [Polyangiaceae bacterium]|nr:bifunctional demethylmenaquinone methyltransferase/2-methoxy-6-polyprenyl-1,4-benzoquinol methylase UbiE [Polyangiaceae bacterium]
MSAETKTLGSGQMFDGIAARYDFVNRVISLGIDQSWRRRTVRSLALAEGARVLDLATGTGDLALLIARATPNSRVVGLDPSGKMLDIAREKVAAAGLDERVELVTGDAEELPFADATFDGVSIAFGIRNVPDRARALAEMARVTKPGGRVAVLELSEPHGGILGPLARFHVHTLVPWVGALLSGAQEYRYLQKSIAAFPPAAEFAAMMERAGLRMLVTEPLTFGVCHLYVGER